MRVWFYTMEHRGGLKEAVETAQEISAETFFRLLDYYHNYGYDDRIHSWRFIHNRFDRTIEPGWLLMSKVPVELWRL